MIIVINKYVESWKSWKLFGGERILRGWKMTWLTWKMNNICEEAIAIFPFDLGSWKFIIGWRLTPCAYNFTFFSLHNFFNRVEEHEYDSQAITPLLQKGQKR